MEDKKRYKITHSQDHKDPLEVIECERDNTITATTIIVMIIILRLVFVFLGIFFRLLFIVLLKEKYELASECCVITFSYDYLYGKIVKLSFIDLL